MAQSGRQTHNPTLALYRKYGALAYRLALAMLGDDDQARDVVASVFEELPGSGTSWHDILSSVHTRCRTAPRNSVTPELVIAAQPTVSDSDPIEGMPYSAHSIHQAYRNLSEADQRILWDTLLARAANSDDLRLAEALRRLQIAVTNQSIPSEEGPA